MLDIVKSIMYHLNDVNLMTMTQKMISLEFKTDEQIDNVVNIIHQKALNRLNYTKVYAQLCANVIKNPLGADDQRSKFQKVLLSKCYDVFYSYNQGNIERSLNKSKLKYISSYSYNNTLANCLFISELYNQGVLSTEVILPFMTDLLNEINNPQIHCLCTFLKLAGPKLSKNCSMAKFVGHLLLLKDESSVCLKLPSEIKLLIDNIKKMHLSYWIYEDPDKFVRERLGISDNSSQINPFTNCQLKTYEYNMMAECIFNECNNLLLNFMEGKYSLKPLKEIQHLLTPAINLLLRHNQVSFIVSLTLAGIGKELKVRILAGKILANLCNTGLLSKYLVIFGFDKISNNYYDDDDTIGLLSQIREEYDHELTTIS